MISYLSTGLQGLSDCETQGAPIEEEIPKVTHTVRILARSASKMQKFRSQGSAELFDPLGPDILVDDKTIPSILPHSIFQE